MPGHLHHADSGYDFTIAVNELKLSCILHGLPVGGYIAGAISFVRRTGVLEFASLHNVPCIWERRNKRTFLPDRVPASVIKMQMSIDDYGDIRRLQSQ